MGLCIRAAGGCGLSCVSIKDNRPALRLFGGPSCVAAGGEEAGLCCAGFGFPLIAPLGIASRAVLDGTGMAAFFFGDT